MASKHILSLEVPTVSSCDILSIRDTSEYSDLIPVDCAELLITVPGFSSSVIVKTTPGFFVNLNACDLHLQNSDCGTTRLELPDGVYVIKYSVSPNDKVYVEYNHLRVTSIMNAYYKVLCCIDLENCEPFSEKKALIEEMQYIRTLIDAAVSKVEYCSSPSMGMDMYTYALKRLDKILCKSCGCN